MTATVGQAKHVYEVDPTWGRRKGGVPAFGVSQGVACDSRDRVYVFNRSPAPRMLVFNRKGKLVDSWGFGHFKHPHGIWCSPEDELYLTDRDTHLVTKWKSDGTFRGMWGSANRPGAPGEPFNQPTKAVETSDGDLYVSDGYGQRRVHRFDRSGNLIRSWGEEGTGPSQFALPHDVFVDSRDRVLLCDRENGRVQHFDRAGDFVAEWTDLAAPMQIAEREGTLYMAEGGLAISVRTLDNELLARWDYSTTSVRAENAPHAIAVDSRGDIYVGEVTGEGGFTKYVRQ